MEEQNMVDPDPLPSRSAAEIDFPLARVEAQHVSRREFAKYLVVVSGGMTAGSGWVAVKDVVRSKRPPTPEARLCSLNDVPNNSMRAFALPESSEPAILVRLKDGTVRAFDQKCTHLSCAVFYSPETGRIECPCHSGAFNATTGDVIAGPPPRALRSFPVEVRDGEVWLLPHSEEDDQ